MAFREKIKRVLRNSNNNNKNNSSKKKSSANSRPLAVNSKGMVVEYYRRNEVPPSKFRGPFDRNFQRQLAAYNFENASADRYRSPDLSLSPCTTLSPQDIKRTLHQTDQPSEEYIEEVAPARSLNGSTNTSQNAQSRPNPHKAEVTSISTTTAVDPESLGSSLSTLLDDSTYGRRDDSVSQLKASANNNNKKDLTSQAACGLPPQGLSSKGTRLPFAPEDLSRALEAAHIQS